MQSAAIGEPFDVVGNGSGITVNAAGTIELSTGVTDTMASINGAGTYTGGAGSVLTTSTSTGATISGRITGALSLVKFGSSILTLSGNSTSTGTITLPAGGLHVHVRGTGNDITLSAATPEPATLGLIAMGAVGLLARRRRSQAVSHSIR